MTNAELLAKIKAEIERLKDENRKIKCEANERYCSGYDDAFYDLVPFLDTLETEKPMNPGEIDLKKELHDFIMEFGPAATFDKCAARFYDLGCRRTAEKYDEIEYNRQRAEESVLNDLEEAAKDILAGFAASEGLAIKNYQAFSCKCAIQLADELIKQLKEREK